MIFLVEKKWNDWIHTNIWSIFRYLNQIRRVLQPFEQQNVIEKSEYRNFAWWLKEKFRQFDIPIALKRNSMESSQKFRTNFSEWFGYWSSIDLWKSMWNSMQTADHDQKWTERVHDVRSSDCHYHCQGEIEHNNMFWYSMHQLERHSFQIKVKPGVFIRNAQWQPKKKSLRKVKSSKFLIDLQSNE